MTGTTKSDMIVQNKMTIGLIDQITILYSMISDSIIAMTTILHPADSGKVRFTEMHVVTIEIPTTNVVTEAKTEVIVKMIMAIKKQ